MPERADGVGLVSRRKGVWFAETEPDKESAAKTGEASRWRGEPRDANRLISEGKKEPSRLEVLTEGIVDVGDRVFIKPFSYIALTR